MKIFLIGFMGVGKTTIGKKLAELLHYSFFDLDKEIENYTKKSISEIFEKDGEKYFREIESFILKSFLNHKNAVISTGGGTPCFFDHMDWMNENGLTTYIKASEDFIYHRLSHAKKPRPLLKDFSEEKLKNFIHAKLEERNSVYKKCQIIYKTPDEKLDSLLEKIFLVLKK